LSALDFVYRLISVARFSTLAAIGFGGGGTLSEGEPEVLLSRF